MNGPPGPVTIIVGYGNPLRGDDGIGPRVAEAVAEWRLPDVRAVAVHQLTPELAEPLAAADRAIFVDARVDHLGEATRVQLLEPAGAATAIGHTGDPRSLLALAQAAFGRHPHAWSITVPATNLTLGEGLSPTAARGIDAALRQIALLLKCSVGHG